MTARVRPAAVGVVLAVVALLGWLLWPSNGGHPNATVPTTSGATSSTTLAVPTTTAAPKSAKPSATLPSQSEYPAYAHMPYSGNGILVTVIGVNTPGYLLTIGVFSQTLTIAQEHAEYAAFLQKYGDSGRMYHPIFASQLSAG